MKTFGRIALGGLGAASTLFAVGLMQSANAGYAYGWGPFEGLLVCAFALLVIAPIHMLALAVFHSRVRDLATVPLVLMSAVCPWVAYPVTALIAGVYVMTKSQPETAITYIVVGGLLIVGYLLTTFVAIKLTQRVLGRLERRKGKGNRAGAASRSTRPRD